MCYGKQETQFLPKQTSKLPTHLCPSWGGSSNAFAVDSNVPAYIHGSAFLWADGLLLLGGHRHPLTCTSDSKLLVTTILLTTFSHIKNKLWSPTERFNGDERPSLTPPLKTFIESSWTTLKTKNYTYKYSCYI